MLNAGMPKTKVIAENLSCLRYISLNMLQTEPTKLSITTKQKRYIGTTILKALLCYGLSKESPDAHAFTAHKMNQVRIYLYANSSDYLLCVKVSDMLLLLI